MWPQKSLTTSINFKPFSPCCQLEDIWEVLQTSIFGILLTKDFGAKDGAIRAKGLAVARTTTMFLAGRILVNTVENKPETTLGFVKIAGAKGGNIICVPIWTNIRNFAGKTKFSQLNTFSVASEYSLMGFSHI